MTRVPKRLPLVKILKVILSGVKEALEALMTVKTPKYRPMAVLCLRPKKSAAKSTGMCKVVVEIFPTLIRPYTEKARIVSMAARIQK